MKNHPFRLANVCAMWITGFDVKLLSTLYLYKPMKSQTLMQIIARANRAHEGRKNGLIADYTEAYKVLLKALIIYEDSREKKGGKGKGDGDEAPVRLLEELIEDMEETLEATELFLKKECDFEIDLIINAEDNLYRIKNLSDVYNAVCISEEHRNKFGVLAREVFKKYKALMPDKFIYKYKHSYGCN